MDPQDVLEVLRDYDQSVRENGAVHENAGIDLSSVASRNQDGSFSASYGPPQTFNVSKGLVRSCGAPVCSKTDNLSRCSACKAILYCSREHQAADRHAHRSACSKIKKALAYLEKEERKLKQEEGEEIFVESRGHFWGLWETRDYMRARYSLVETFLKINTTLAITTALDHLLDMLSLCRSDNMGVRDVVPGLYLRLGREQECYDFCKWWATTGQDSHYDWGDLDNPYLDTKDADVFEGVNLFTQEYLIMAHSVAVMLIKIRLMIDLQALQRARQEAGPHVPREVLDEICQNATSVAATKKPNILECDDHGPHITELKKQIKELYASSKRANKHFWPAVLRPGENLYARPNSYSMGDKGHMQLVLQYSYNAWKETPGAIEVIELLEKQHS